MQKPRTSWVNGIPEGSLLLQQDLQDLYHLVIKGHILAGQVRGWSLKETTRKNVTEKIIKFYFVGSKEYHLHNYKKTNFTAIHENKDLGILLVTSST